MKQFSLEFLRRGLVACGVGPMVLAVLYLIIPKSATLETLSGHEVCTGIFSLTALAFIAGGINAIYQMERLPLMVAILIHGCVLYVCYLITYLVNHWLELGKIPVLVFSGAFIVGYFAIWAIIYTIIKRKTAKLNEMLKQKQREQA